MMLADLNPDLIKIDRELVQGDAKSEMHRIIVRALVQIARESGSLVLAEGVETEDELAGATALVHINFAQTQLILAALAIAAMAERFKEATANAFTTFPGTVPAACRTHAIVISTLEISLERSKNKIPFSSRF